MKKRKIQLISIALVLVLFVGAYFGISAYKTNQAAKLANAQIIQIAKMTDLTSISYSNGDEDLSFTYDAENGKWIYDQIPDFPLQKSPFTKIQDTLANFVALREVSISEELDAYGLAEPSRTLQATDTDGNTISLLIGSDSGDGEIDDAGQPLHYYAMKNGGSSVYTISNDLYTLLSQGLYDIISIDNFPFATERTMNYIVLQSGETTLRFEKEAVEMTEEEKAQSLIANSGYHYFWYLVRKDGSRLSLSDLTLIDNNGQEVAGKQYIDDLVEFIKGGAFADCIDYKADKESLEKYGITDPTLKITVSFNKSDGDEQVFVVDVGGFVEKDTEEESYYIAKLESSPQLSVLAATDINICRNAFQAYTALLG